MSARFLCRFALAIFVGAGASTALAQQSEVSITEIQPENIRLRPGFQQDVSIRGDAKIESIHVGDPSVAVVTAVSDRRFLINALPPDTNTPPGPRATNVLVRDANKNVIANLEVEVAYFASAGSRMVEIHKRVGGNATAGGGRTEQFAGVYTYLCSPVRCELIARDKAEMAAQIIQQKTSTYNETAAPPAR